MLSAARMRQVKPSCNGKGNHACIVLSRPAILGPFIHPGITTTKRAEPLGVAQLDGRSTIQEVTTPEPSTSGAPIDAFEAARLARQQQRQRDQVTYQVAAIAATCGISSLAIVATYMRYTLHMQDNEFPVAEFLGTLTLVAGGVIGMEMWAKWAHKALWHDYTPGWALHKSHHTPRLGMFEDNDIYAAINAVPAMALCAYGFATPNMLGGLCFGAGLGISLFGIMYMFVHDGLVHRRFPVGPIAEWPVLKRVAVAHQLHHSGKFDGAPWGMFLGPQEIEALPGGKEELDRLVADLDRSKVARAAAEHRN